MNSLVTGALDRSGFSRTQLQIKLLVIDQKWHMGSLRALRSRLIQLSSSPGMKDGTYLSDCQPRSKILEEGLKLTE